MESVVLEHITKSYGKEQKPAAEDITFSINKGELFGLIGPDGAGKTTIFRILTTVLLADKGSARVDGYDVVKSYREIRNRVGYMPGRFSLYPDLTVEENLDFFATVFNTTIEDNYDLIKDIYVQIEPFKKRRAGKLSGGMKQKLALCCALIHKPTVLFLDEPTTGVDPVSRKEFWAMLKQLQQQDITIVVSTPYMDEAAMCDRIALIQSGRILSIDTPEAISAAYPGQLYQLRSGNMYTLMNLINQYGGVEQCYRFGEYLHVTMSNGDKTGIDRLVAFLQNNGMTDIETAPITATVEDSFIKLLKE